MGTLETEYHLATCLHTPLMGRSLKLRYKYFTPFCNLQGTILLQHLHKSRY